MFSHRYIWAFLFIVFLILELANIKSLTLFGTRPDFILILTVFAGLNQGILYGASLGFAGGLAKEIFSNALLGPLAFSLTLSGFIAGLFGQRVFYQNVFIQAIIIFMATLFKMTLTSWLLIFIHHSSYPSRAFISQAFYNALITPPIYFLLSNLFSNKR